MSVSFSKRKISSRDFPIQILPTVEFFRTLFMIETQILIIRLWNAGITVGTNLQSTEASYLPLS